MIRNKIDNGFRHVLGICMATNVIMVFVAIHLWGAAEVRADVGDLVFLVFIGAVWLMLAAKLFSWLGLSFNDEVIERRNLPASIALSGGLTSVAFIYAGGNLGEGPSFLNNFFSAGLGTAGLLTLWFSLELLARVSFSIAEERNLAAGIRLGGFLLAMGLMLGRAVAGDWHSTTATIHDFFRDAWSAGMLWLVALIIELFARPNRQRPFPSWQKCGLLPASFYLLFAFWWLWHLGRWEGMS